MRIIETLSRKTSNSLILYIWHLFLLIIIILYIMNNLLVEYILYELFGWWSEFSFYSNISIWFIHYKQSYNTYSIIAHCSFIPPTITSSPPPPHMCLKNHQSSKCTKWAIYLKKLSLFPPQRVNIYDRQQRLQCQNVYCSGYQLY